MIRLETVNGVVNITMALADLESLLEDEVADVPAALQSLLYRAVCIKRDGSKTRLQLRIRRLQREERSRG